MFFCAKMGGKGDHMNWLMKHADTIAILSTFALCFWTLNEKISKIESDIIVIKTVMVMKNIMPAELTTKTEE